MTSCKVSNLPYATLHCMWYRKEKPVIIIILLLNTCSPLFAAGAFVPVVSLLSNVLIPSDTMNIKIILKKISVA